MFRVATNLRQSLNRPATFHSAARLFAWPTGRNGRPLNAYIKFCNEHRFRLTKEQPELDPKDVTRKLGEKWKELPESEKSRLKEEYQQEFQKFKEARALGQ